MERHKQHQRKMTLLPRDFFAMIMCFFLIRLLLLTSSKYGNDDWDISLSFYTEYDNSNSGDIVSYPVPISLQGMDALVIPNGNEIRLVPLKNKRLQKKRYGWSSSCRSDSPFYAETVWHWSVGEKNETGTVSNETIVQLTAWAEADEGQPGDIINVASVLKSGNVIRQQITFYDGNDVESMKATVRLLWKKQILDQNSLQKTESIVYESSMRYIILSSQSSLTGLLSYHAIHEDTGDIIWNRHFHSQKKIVNETTTSTSSSTSKPQFFYPTDPRIRKKLRLQHNLEDETEDHTRDCLLHFRQFILSPQSNVLPHMFWNYTYFQLAYFHPEAAKKQKKRKATATSSSQQTKNHNILISHSQTGIHVLSLKNGHSLCHLSLLPYPYYYADLNRDGIVDFLQFPPFATHDHECHVSAFSGIPSREQLFHSDAILCPKRLQQRSGGVVPIDNSIIAPPLMLQDGNVLILTQKGVTSKIHSDGTFIWQKIEPIVRKVENTLPFPWEDEEENDIHSSPLFLLQLKDLPNQPVFVSGQDKAVLLSSQHGQILSFAAYPQESLSRSIIFYESSSSQNQKQFLIVSMDAIWGYTIFMTGSHWNLSMIMIYFVVFMLIITWSLKALGFVKNHKRGTDI